MVTTTIDSLEALLRQREVEFPKAAKEIYSSLRFRQKRYVDTLAAIREMEVEARQFRETIILYAKEQIEVIRQERKLAEDWKTPPEEFTTRTQRHIDFFSLVIRLEEEYFRLPTET